MLDGGIRRTVRSGEIDLATAEAGDAGQPTVVFVHGYPDTKELWDGVGARLGPRYHLVAYDVRGAGESSRPRRNAAYDLERLGDDLEAIIAAVSPRRPVHLVGHDWGAIQGWEFATLERFRGKLASLTAIAGPPLGCATSRGREFVRRGALGGLRRSWYVVGLCLPGGPTLAWRWLLGADRWVWLMRNVERIAGTEQAPPTLADDGIDGAKLYRRNIPRRLLRPRRDAIAHVPVQLVVPTRDHFIPPAYYEGVDRVAPVLCTRVIGATHWAPRTEPDLVARWVARFVDEVEAGSATGSRPHWVRGAGVQQLAGRLALVTGAASGIGRATAKALADLGVRVLLVDRDENQLTSARTEIGAAEAFVSDVGDERAMQLLCDKVLARFGTPDVLVNNAGIGVAGPLLATPAREWRRVLDVNLMGVVHGCRLFGRAMVERGEGGQIVNLASAAAFQPTKDLPAYAASKAAVLMVSECLRAELAPHGIGVTAVCPGFVHTNITRAAHYAGRGQAEQRRIGEQVTRQYERRNFTPERAATEIIRAIGLDLPVALVTPEARVLRALARFSPSLRRRLATLDTLPA